MNTKSVHDILKVPSLRIIERELHEGLGNWDKPRELYLEISGTATDSAQHSGLNGRVNRTEFKTKLYDVRSFKFRKWSRSDLLCIYFNLNEHVDDFEGTRMRRDNCYLVQYRDSKNELQAIEVEDQDTDRLRDVIGKSFDSKVELLDIPDIAPCKVISAYHNINRDRLREPYFDQVEECARYNDPSKSEDLFKAFSEIGLSLVGVFSYNFKIWAIRPEWVNRSENAIEFGYQTGGTYCSHPRIVKIFNSKPVKTVRLVDIDAEDKGYYSHDNRLEVLASEKQTILKHVRRYRAGLNNIREVKRGTK